MNWLHLCVEHKTFVNHHETIWGLHSHATLHRLVNVTLGHLAGSEWNENPFRNKSHHSAFSNAFVFNLVVILNHYLFYFTFKLNIYYVSYKTGKLNIIGNKCAHYTAALISTFPEKCTLYSTVHTPVYKYKCSDVAHYGMGCMAAQHRTVHQASDISAAP